MRGGSKFVYAFFRHFSM